MDGFYPLGPGTALATDLTTGSVPVAWKHTKPTRARNGEMLHNTRWWFQIYCLFSTLPGEMIQFDDYFSNELKPPTRIL